MPYAINQYLPAPPSGVPIPTVRIVSAEHESGYIIINRDAFDPARHTEYHEPAPSVPAEAPPASALTPVKSATRRPASGV